MFRRYLENPKDPNTFEGPVVVFDGPEDYLKRIEDVPTPIDDVDCSIAVLHTGW